jgi:uncharacterized membrane protein (TIGR02234 family)
MGESPGRRSSFGPTVLLGLGGAALATIGATQPWAEATTRSPGVRTVTASGTDVAPAVLALALVALACWGTVLVLRRRGRRVVSVLGALVAAVAAVTALTSAGSGPEVAARLIGGEPDSTSTSAWPYVTAAGCLVAAGAFVVAFLHAGRWPEMSSRYDAPGSGPDRPEQTTGDADDRPRSGAELWKALDEGEDPTL